MQKGVLSRCMDPYTFIIPMYGSIHFLQSSLLFQTAAGIEPATFRLKGERSASKLRRRILVVMF